LAFVADLRGVTGLDGLNLIPCFIINYPQIRDFSNRPFMFRVKPGCSLSCLRVFYETLAVIDDLALIELIVENAVAALTGTIDGGGIPQAATRAGDIMVLSDECELVSVWQ